MLDILCILLAGLIVAAVGLPIVNAYEKWKKETEHTGENDERRD